MRATRKVESTPEMFRITLAVDAQYRAVEVAIESYLKASGGIRKHGAAPKGSLEVDAARLLERFQK